MEQENRDGGKLNSGAAKCLMMLAAAVFLAAAVASILILRPSKERLVEVAQDDVVLYTIDLETAEDMTFTVFYMQRSNTITVKNGEIWVSAAECPDHTCMKMGKLRSKRLPIVCLPNRLVIRFAE